MEHTVWLNDFDFSEKMDIPILLQGKRPPRYPDHLELYEWWKLLITTENDQIEQDIVKLSFARTNKFSEMSGS